MKPYNTGADLITESGVLQTLLARAKGGAGRKELGAAGEDLAAGYLELGGYAILERNFRTRYGEIDLIASRGGVIFFIEVKTRRSAACGFAEEAVNGAKRKKIFGMARRYIAENRRLADSEIAFMLVAIQISGNEVSVKTLPMA